MVYLGCFSWYLQVVGKWQVSNEFKRLWEQATCTIAGAAAWEVRCCMLLTFYTQCKLVVAFFWLRIRKEEPLRQTSCVKDLWLWSPVHGQKFTVTQLVILAERHRNFLLLSEDTGMMVGKVDHFKSMVTCMVLEFTCPCVYLEGRLCHFHFVLLNMIWLSTKKKFGKASLTDE